MAIERFLAAIVGIASIVSCDQSTEKPSVASDAGFDASNVDPMLSSLRKAERVLFISAHPDDETMVAPLLAEACLASNAQCTLLVLTRGENGHCPGCTEDTGTVRARELAASAAIFGAEVILWDFENHIGNFDDTLNSWSLKAGSSDQLVDKIAVEIERIDPSLILSFDARHGGTCNANHRVAGALVLSASAKANVPSGSVWLIGSTISVVGEDPDYESAGYVPMVLADESLWRYEATQPLPGGSTGWDFVVDVHSAHPTQFSTADVAAFANAPLSERAVYIAPLSELRLDDSRYEGVCF